MLLLLLFLLLLRSPSIAAAATVTLILQPDFPTTPTIPAFPEQSATSSSSCPLSLPLRRPTDALRPSCSPSSHRLQCCPALATLLFSSFPLRQHPSSSSPAKQGGYNMPEVPEDTEMCSEQIGKALSDAGVEVSYHNTSCDLVFCYCGIRLHRMSCEMDDHIFHDRVRALARECSSPGIEGCSKCLTSLSMISPEVGNGGSNSSEGLRTTKVHQQDCQLMGLAWLLARNHSAYARTVTSVFRAMMSSHDGSVPKSCTVGNDGLPLAVDSSQLSGSSTRPTYASWSSVFLVRFVCLVHVVSFIVSIGF